MHERERLIARIRQVRRATRPANAAPDAPATARDPDQLHALETRIAHLEDLVQGLQDSVHREASRSAKRITELEARTQPAALAKALSDDARERGI